MVLISAVAGAAMAQGPAREVFVSAPSVRLICGEQTKLEAVARDANGVARRGDTFSWTSNNTNIATVDSTGRVSSRGLGMVNITVTIPGVAGIRAAVVQLQILPQQIVVTPNKVRAKTGDRVPFTASALDVNGAPISGATFNWQVSNSQAGGTQNARIDAATGVMTARSPGLIIVRAVINYAVPQTGFAPQAVGQAEADIREPEWFRLTKVLSSEQTLNTYTLKPYTGAVRVAMNERGVVAYQASLDGLSTGVVLHEAGRNDLVVATGIPGPMQGGVLQGFGPESIAISPNGEMLFGVFTFGNGAGLYRASRSGAWPFLLNGQNGGGYEQMTGFSAYSLNDHGEAALAASFRWPDTPAVVQYGLFRFAGGGLDLLWSRGQSLQGLTGTITINQTGIDSEGTIYFLASGGGQTGIFRRTGFDQPSRIMGSGDVIDGVTIRSVGSLVVAADGSIAYRLDPTQGQPQIVRWVNGKRDSLPLRSLQGVYGIASGGALTFVGDNGSGNGAYRWSGSTVTALQLVQRQGPGGETVQSIPFTQITREGRVLALLRNNLNIFQMAWVDEPRSVAFQTGTRLSGTANVTLLSLVKGVYSGPLSMILGSSPGSLFEYDGRGPAQRLIAGDRLPSGSIFSGTGVAYGGAAGDIVVAGGDGNPYRLRAGKVDLLAKSISGETLTVSANRPVAVSGNGWSAWESSTNRGHARLFATDGTAVKVLAENGAAAPYQTDVPSAGPVIGWDANRIAIDDAGRVLAQLTVRNAPVSLYLLENGRWRQVAVANETETDGGIVTGFSIVRAVNDRLFALMPLRGGGNILAEWTGRWTTLMRVGEYAPTGAQINAINNFDVNGRGDIAVVCSLLAGGTAVLLKTGDEMRTVQMIQLPTPQGDYFSSFSDVVLRDDRKLYFSGLDVLDRQVVYLAEPQF